MSGNFLFKFLEEAEDQELVPFLHLHQEFYTSEQLFEQLKTIFYTCDNPDLQQRIADVFIKWFSLRFKKDFWNNKPLLENILSFSKYLDKVFENNKKKALEANPTIKLSYPTPTVFAYENRFKLLFLQAAGRKSVKENPKRYITKEEFKKLIETEEGDAFKSLLLSQSAHLDGLVAQLIIHDWTMFSSIESYELISSTWKRIPNSAVKNVVQYFNKFAHFVGTTILTENDAETREKLVCRFIMLADDCREKRNYNSLMNILAGLNLHPVSRLKQLWAKIPRKVMEVKEKLDDLMDTRYNYRNYRNSLAASATSFVIPYIGIYLRDILFIEEGNPAKLENGQLNRERITLLAQVLKEIQKFQSQKLPPKLGTNLSSSGSSNAISGNAIFRDSNGTPISDRDFIEFLEKLTGCSEKDMDQISQSLEGHRGSYVAESEIVRSASSNSISE